MEALLGDPKTGPTEELARLWEEVARLRKVLEETQKKSDSEEDKDAS